MYRNHSIIKFIIISVVLVIGGCQTGQQSGIKDYSNNLQLSEAALPNYAVGEYFTFDDGTTAAVTEVSDELITFRYNNGAISRSYRNFILPAPTWTSANKHSEGTSTAPPDFLWPLAVGKRDQYDSQQVISRNDGTELTELSRSWNCVVEGTERVSVPAGTFDTYVVTCKRYSSSGRSWRATRKYYYAPDLGHYVIREDNYRSRSDKRRELVAYGFNSTVLPKQDQINLNRKLQKTLSNNSDGIADTWRSRTGEVTAMLIPVNSYTGLDGDKCREYHSVYSVKGRIRKNVRQVCRLPEGHWQRVE